MGVKTNKAQYFDKLKVLLEEYRSIFIVTVDNVGLIPGLVFVWSGYGSV